MADTSFRKYLEEKIIQNPTLKQELEKARRAIGIAHQVYKLRKERGLTQKELAKQIGISQSNIARIESADYNHYTPATLYKVKRGLNVDLISSEQPNKLIADNSLSTFKRFNIAAGDSGGFSTLAIGTVNNVIRKETVDMMPRVESDSEASAGQFFYQRL